MDPAPVGRCCGVRPLELPTDGAGIADLQQIVMRELRFEREAVLLDVRGPSFRIESREAHNGPSQNGGLKPIL